MADAQDKLIILDREHPLVKHIEQFNWSEVLNFGLVSIQIREGRARLVTVQTTLKLD